MRHIGNLPNAAQGQLFRDYLYAQGIANQLEQDTDESWMIWVASEEQLETARKMLEHFRRDPAAPEFARAAAEAERVRDENVKEEEQYRERFFTRSRVFRNSAGFTAGILTYVLIVTCVLVALSSQMGEDENRLRNFFISYPEPGTTGFLPEVRAGQVWRLFTPVLMHFGPIHLFFNMLWLFHLGSMVESRQGHTHFALLVLALAIGSNVPQYAFGGPAFGGMSGVIYGLFGYVWLRGKLDPGSGLFIDRQNIVLMLIWFAACFAGWVGPVANVAHGAGLVLGAAYGCLSGLLARRSKPG